MEKVPKIRLGFIAKNNDKGEIRWAAEHGIPLVEYNYPTEFDETFPETEQVRACLRQHGVDVCAAGCWGQEFISLDSAKKEKAIQRLKGTIQFAHDIGCPVVMTGGGDREGDGLKSKLNDVVEAYKGIADYAAERGVRVCFYNCHWNNCVIGPDAWDFLLPALPGIGIKFDPSHPYHDGQDPYVQLADYGEHVFHVHAKEVLYVGGGPREGGQAVDEPMAGMGDFHWGKFIALLYRARYSGAISIEPHSKTWSGALVHPGILSAKRHLEQFIV
ncbi:MAG: sugar phosphate isomerase/epimerase [Armatimonadetes bacterium]|nr:sugar phosphate isomerase/epimerase [Armatimonadota bacterium]